jgi:Rieske Fe-S protein
LTRDEASKLEQNKFVIVPVSSQRVIVFQSQDQLCALSAKCTHEGCTVTYQPGQSVIWVSVPRWSLRSQWPRDIRAAAAAIDQIPGSTPTDGGIVISEEKA